MQRNMYRGSCKDLPPSNGGPFEISKRGLRRGRIGPPLKNYVFILKIRAILGIINWNIIFPNDSGAWLCFYFWKRKVEGGGSPIQLYSSTGNLQIIQSLIWYA